MHSAVTVGPSNVTINQKQADWFSGRLEKFRSAYKDLDRRSDPYLRRIIASIAIYSSLADRWPELRKIIAVSLHEHRKEKFRVAKQTHCIAKLIAQPASSFEMNKVNRYARCADRIKGKFKTIEAGALYIRQQGGIDKINTVRNPGRIIGKARVATASPNVTTRRTDHTGQFEPAPSLGAGDKLIVEVTPEQLDSVLSAAGKTISIPVRVEDGPGWKRVVMVGGLEGNDDHEDIYDVVVTDDFEDGV